MAEMNKVLAKYQDLLRDVGAGAPVADLVDAVEDMAAEIERLDKCIADWARVLQRAIRWWPNDG